MIDSMTDEKTRTESKSAKYVLIRRPRQIGHQLDECTHTILDITLRCPLAFIIVTFRPHSHPLLLSAYGALQNLSGKESASSHEVRVITILFRERSEIQSDRERHEMFIYCFYHHVNHLNGSYVMKICREGKAEKEMRV